MGYYDDALTVCEKYLKGNAKGFLDRQIGSHLKKEPTDLDKTADSAELGKWCRVSAELVLGTAKATALEQDILAA
ncbi:MAG: hypothetical protein V3S31_01220 [Dehalococcoidia bacterium]